MAGDEGSGRRAPLLPSPVPEAGLADLVAFVRRQRWFDLVEAAGAVPLDQAVRRRLDVLGLATPGEYIDHLVLHPEELDVLVEAQAGPAPPWPTLGWFDRVADRLLAGVDGGDDPARPLRIWVAGCGTGEGVYGLVMALAERLGEVEVTRRVTVYATDTDETLLARARRPAFTDADLAAVESERRQRFFTSTAGATVFEPTLRDRIVFGRHDLALDPAVGAVDLLVCEGVLPRLDADVRAAVLRRLAGALRPGGQVVLAPGEAPALEAIALDVVASDPPVLARPPADGGSAGPDQTLDQGGGRVEALAGQLDEVNQVLEATSQELRATVAELELTTAELTVAGDSIDAITAEMAATDEHLAAVNDELRQRSAEVDEVNALLGSVLDGLEDAVVVVDGDLRVRTWNRRAHELWGLKPEEAVQRSLLALDIGLPVDRLADPLRATLAGDGGDERLSIEAVDRRSRALRCDVRCRAVRRDDGTVDGAVVVVTAAPTGDPPDAGAAPR